MKGISFDVKLTKNIVKLVNEIIKINNLFKICGTPIFLENCLNSLIKIIIFVDNSVPDLNIQVFKECMNQLILFSNFEVREYNLVFEKFYVDTVSEANVIGAKIIFDGIVGIKYNITKLANGSCECILSTNIENRGQMSLFMYNLQKININIRNSRKLLY
jgi:hypothetical protein